MPEAPDNGIGQLTDLRTPPRSTSQPGPRRNRTTVFRQLPSPTEVFLNREIPHATDAPMPALQLRRDTSSLRAAVPEDKAAPFLKWVGGKTSLLPELLRHVPPRLRRYQEPFVGGGALFFAVAPRRATLSDNNAELVHCYSQIRDDVSGV